ncbi:hypothetical protein [Labilibacter marinus]|uniref:hypothetical protein n=1 Tax=Labilibacter marinus TaxID=1477105 RepID=UPI00082BB2C3|nr:hypothetical protein [Labilibacter marinus]
MKFIYLAILLIFTSCGKSILSDMEITDPQAIKVKVKIEQGEPDEKEIQVYIRDTKNHPIEMLDGKVLVNNQRLSFERATVNAMGARGYMYTPFDDEDIFEITIYWNSHDKHTFVLSPATGWPGFYSNADCGCVHDGYKEHESFEIKPAPFHDKLIEVSYNILK